MKQIIYTSVRNELFSVHEIIEMLKMAQEDNKSNGISGILIYSNNQFLQVFEGMNSTVDHLKRKILSDKRHKNIIIISENKINELEYTYWDMAFCDEKSIHKFMGEEVFNPCKMSFNQADTLLKKFKTHTLNSET